MNNHRRAHRFGDLIVENRIYKDILRIPMTLKTMFIIIKKFVNLSVITIIRFFLALLAGNKIRKN
ncbi:MAG: hypothetical protein GXO83_10740 [Chlorobi bacterium]|nr:hypothetical protein [Chlorobiota bacterium]